MNMMRTETAILDVFNIIGFIIFSKNFFLIEELKFLYEETYIQLIFLIFSIIHRNSFK